MESEVQGQVMEFELGFVSKYLIFYSIHIQRWPSVPSPNLGDPGAPEATSQTGKTHRPPCSVGQVSQEGWRLQDPEAGWERTAEPTWRRSIRARTLKTYAR